MEEFLSNNDLGDLCEIFTANEIVNLELLEELFTLPNELEKLVPNLRKRLDLQKAYKKYIEEANKQLIATIISSDGSTSEVNVNDITISNVLGNTVAQPSTSSTNIQQPIVLQTIKEDIVSEPAQKKRKVKSDAFEFDVKACLEAHPLGIALLTIGEQYKTLSSKHQCLLVELITLDLLKIEKGVKNEDYSVLAEQIVSLFPDECKETYYVKPVSKKHSRNNKSEISKGKLPDKYRNYRAIINEAKREARQFIGTTHHNTALEEELINAEKSKIWLTHNREESEVIHHWDTSYPLRQLDCENKVYSRVEQIFNIWPILKESKGFELIERDFSKQYPDSRDKFILNWNQFFPRIFKLYKHKLSEEDLVYAQLLDNTENNILNPDSRTVIQFYLLASLMAPKSNKINLKKLKNPPPNKTFWKPTVADSREGFILHVKIPGQIENTLEARRAKLAKLGLHLQPQVITVGPDFRNIQKVYVRVDAVSYEVPSVLKAVDVLFKLHVGFNIAYPKECENFCYLIQWGVYILRTESDEQIPFVFNTLNNIEKRNKNKVSS